MEKQNSLFDHDISPAWLYKKDLIKDPIEVRIVRVEVEKKNGKQDILAHIISKEQGDRIVSLRVSQYTYLRNMESKLRETDYKVWMKCYQKSDKEYTMILSLDKEMYI